MCSLERGIFAAFGEPPETRDPMSGERLGLQMVHKYPFTPYIALTVRLSISHTYSCLSGNLGYYA